MMMMMMMGRGMRKRCMSSHVAVVGSVCVDSFIGVPRLPQSGETLASSDPRSLNVFPVRRAIPDYLSLSSLSQTHTHIHTHRAVKARIRQLQYLCSSPNHFLLEE